MKIVLLIALVAISIWMILLSFKMGILPPGLTGAGFILVALLFGLKMKNK